MLNWSYASLMHTAMVVQLRRNPSTCLQREQYASRSRISAHRHDHGLQHAKSALIRPAHNSGGVLHMCHIRVPFTAMQVTRFLKCSGCHCKLLHVALSGLPLVKDRPDVKVRSPVVLDPDLHAARMCRRLAASCTLSLARTSVIMPFILT